MGIYDYLILAFYFLFMIGIGVLFRRFNSDISDYFRGGGTMLWWMSGASALMGALSVWSFTGAAAKIYQTGFLVLAIYLSGWVSNIVVFLFSCYRFRQMRVITSVEAIRRRYGGQTEQFYVWMQVPIGIVYGAVSLNAVGVFISSVFGTNLLLTVLVVGVIVLFVASSGGAWAVVAGDFVQMLIILLVSGITVFLVLRMPEVGGVTGLLHKLPASDFSLTQFEGPGMIAFWISAIVLQNLLIANDLSQGAARFMTVKDGKHARKAALMIIFVYAFLTFLVFIPPLAAVIVFPDLATHFANLKQPSEGAYVAMCVKVLPHGLLGLMVSGIFAVAMAGLDTGLNRNVGVFVNNFYRRIIRPHASASELLLAGRVCTAVFGALIIGLGMLIAVYRSLNLFDFVLMIGSLMGIPLIVPMVLGLFIKRTPSWSGWSTALLGFGLASLAKWVIGARLYTVFTGTDPASLNPQEITDITFATTVFLVTLGDVAWYWFSMRFAENDSKEYRQEVESFFHDMNTPIDPVKENIIYDDGRQYQTIGLLCLIYGGAMLLGVLIPNPLIGRLCFMFVSGVLLLIGWLLYSNRLKGIRRDLEATVEGVAVVSGVIVNPPERLDK